jgi:hypothetical protein
MLVAEVCRKCAVSSMPIAGSTFSPAPLLARSHNNSGSRRRLDISAQELTAES